MTEAGILQHIRLRDMQRNNATTDKTYESCFMKFSFAICACLSNLVYQRKIENFRLMSKEVRVKLTKHKLENLKELKVI